MSKLITAALGVALAAGLAAAPAAAQSVSAYGGFNTPESAVYDPVNDRYLVTSAGAFGPANDGYISALDPDGTIQVSRWIAASDELELANPLGAAVHDGTYYVADTPNHVRMFDLVTGAPIGAVEVPGAATLNDLTVAADGTVYVTDTGPFGGEPNPDAFAVYKISPAGEVSTLISGDALAAPNGIELDIDGRLVVVQIGSPNLLFLTPDGAIDDTVELPAGGNDGIGILDDGILISNVQGGAIWKLDRATGEITTVVEGLMQPASIGFDPTRNRVIVPQLGQHTVTLLDVE